MFLIVLGLVKRLLYNDRQHVDGRLWEIDGMRGWAALAVVLYHSRYWGFGMGSGDDSFFFRTCANGPLSVNIFFVLSGDALAYALFRGSVGVVVKRVARLSGTVSIGIAFLYILRKAGMICEQETGSSEGWDRKWSCPANASQYSFIDYFFYAWVGVYAGGSGPNFDTFLWSIEAELRGSILVFALAAALIQLRFRVYLLAVLTVYLMRYFDILYALFAFGMLLGELRSVGVFEFFHNNRIMRIVAGCAVILLPFITAYPDSFSLLTKMNLFDLVRWNKDYLAMVVVGVLYCSKDAVSFLGSPISRFFGKIAFCIYVTHHHVLSSFYAWLIGQTSDPASESTRNWVTAATLTVCVTVGWLAHLVEARYLGWLDRVANQLIEPSGDGELPKVAMPSIKD